MQYEAREKALKDIASIRGDGVEEGRIEGRIEGKIEGKIEEKKAIARSMIKEGMDIHLIMRLTKLTEEEVKRLAEDLH